jgi:hypothetical protein
LTRWNEKKKKIDISFQKNLLFFVFLFFFWFFISFRQSHNTQYTQKMSLKLLTSRIIARPYMPVVRKSATWAVYRGYASKFFLIDKE